MTVLSSLATSAPRFHLLKCDQICGHSYPGHYCQNDEGGGFCVACREECHVVRWHSYWDRICTIRSLLPPTEDVVSAYLRLEKFNLRLVQHRQAYPVGLLFGQRLTAVSTAASETASVWRRGRGATGAELLLYVAVRARLPTCYPVSASARVAATQHRR